MSASARSGTDPGGVTRPGGADRDMGYQWSKGAWFGPLLGCTLWMLLLGGMAWRVDAVSGMTAVGAWALANGLGLWLWSRRAELRAPTALQLMLGVTGALALGTLFVLDGRVDLASLEGELATGLGSRQLYGALLVYPILMFVFWKR